MTKADFCLRQAGLTPIPEKTLDRARDDKSRVTGYEREDLADLATGTAADWESGG